MKKITIEELFLLEAVTELGLTIEAIESVRYELPDFHERIVDEITNIINKKYETIKDLDEYLLRFEKFSKNYTENETA